MLLCPKVSQQIPLRFRGKQQKQDPVSLIPILVGFLMTINEDIYSVSSSAVGHKMWGLSRETFIGADISSRDRSPTHCRNATIVKTHLINCLRKLFMFFFMSCEAAFS